MTFTDESFFTLSRINETLVLDFTCDIDFTNATAVARYLVAIADQNPGGKVVADFQNLAYIDSAGIATLLQVVAHFQSQDARLIFCNINVQVQGLFEIAKLDEVFTTADSLDTALMG